MLRIGSKSKRISLSIKICYLSMVILSVILASYAYFTCTDSISEINEQYRGRALTLVTMVDAMINTEADLNHESHIQQYFDELVKIDKNVLKISLYVKQPDGRVIRSVSSAHHQIGQPADSFDADPIRTGKVVWEEEFENEEAEEKATETAENEEEEGGIEANHIVEVLAPIYVEGKRQASLGVYMDLSPKDQAVAEYVNRAIAYTIFALIALACLLYGAIRKEVFKPLWHLSEGVKEVAKGNLCKRVNSRRNDEFGELAREFDNMAEALQQREEENKRLLNTLEEKWAEAEEKSHTDFLTKLENHRSFQDRLDNEINRAAETHEHLSILFCDLDGFKSFNDINGHLLGDKALFDVADIIKNSIRDCDVAARYGGEEFAAVLPKTDSDEAYALAERIRNNVENHRFSTKFGLGYMTVSIGVATYPFDAGEKVYLIEAADAAMYASKYAGKNKVKLFNSIKRDQKQAS